MIVLGISSGLKMKYICGDIVMVNDLKSYFPRFKCLYEVKSDGTRVKIDSLMVELTGIGYEVEEIDEVEQDSVKEWGIKLRRRLRQQRSTS